MEDSWEICPYCTRTGFHGPGLAGTRVEETAAVAVASAAAPAVRKTILLSQKHKPPVVGWFVSLDGEQKGQDFRLRDGQNIVGSDSSCDVVLTDSTVSSKHASLRFKDGKFILSDLDSTNGSFLNDNNDPIAREEIKDNDVIRLGDIRLKFKCL